MKFLIAVSAEIKPDFVSSAIMRFTKADYSHMLIIAGDDVYHSTGKGFHKMPLAKFLQGRKIVHQREVIPCNESYALGWLDGNRGRGYSESQYLGFLFKWTQRFVSNGREQAICSEIAANFVSEVCGMTIAGNPDFLSPKDAWLQIEKATEQC